MKAEPKADEFLPKTVNHKPPIRPELELKLYSISGAMLNWMEKGRITGLGDPSAVNPVFPEK